MSEMREVKVGDLVVYRSGEDLEYVAIEDGLKDTALVPLDDVIPFVKAIFTVTTGREFREESRWGKPDPGDDDE